jgi:hypothetical protein
MVGKRRRRRKQMRYPLCTCMYRCTGAVQVRVVTTTVRRSVGPGLTPLVHALVSLLLVEWHKGA